jgi:CheY-like chemotaxis protein
MSAAAGYVLVVDDDEAIRLVLLETLRNDGRDVVSAADGDEALEIMERPRLPELVILDLMMPRISGWQVLERMERSPRLSGIPVVVLTAFDSRADLPIGRSIVHKPIEGPLLLDLTRALLEQDRRLAFSLDEPPSDLMPQRLGMPKARTTVR